MKRFLVFVGIVCLGIGLFLGVTKGIMQTYVVDKNKEAIAFVSEFFKWIMFGFFCAGVCFALSKIVGDKQASEQAQDKKVIENLIIKSDIVKNSVSVRDDEILGILRKSLNDLYNDVPSEEIFNELNMYKHDEIKRIVNLLEKTNSKDEQMDILKSEINKLK